MTRVADISNHEQKVSPDEARAVHCFVEPSRDIWDGEISSTNFLENLLPSCSPSVETNDFLRLLSAMNANQNEIVVDNHMLTESRTERRIMQ